MTTEDWCMFVADRWFREIKHALQSKGCYAAALAGGNTPYPVYACLSALLSDLNFEQRRAILFVPVDERMVPVTDIASNGGRLAGLFEKTGVNIVLPDTTLPPDAAASLFQSSIIRHFQGIKQPVFFDHIMLGLGNDGHVASIFLEMLGERKIEEPGICASGPFFGYERITFTYPWLKLSTRRWVLATGIEKGMLLQSIILTPQRSMPVERLFTDGAAPLEWFILC